MDHEGLEPVVDELGLDGPDLAELADRCASFARMAHVRLPLYERLTAAAAGDQDVLGRLMRGHVDQRVPTLLLAAVHDVLLAGESDPLAAWYGSVTDVPRPVSDGEGDPWPHFRRLVLDHPAVDHNIRTGSTQTNEIGRCAPMALALAQVSSDAPGAPPDGRRPLGLVEVGASAGLNLHLDQYGYRYHPPSGPPHEVNAAAFLVLDCDLRGGETAPVPDALPDIVSRVGIDHHPVDVSDRRQARWLVACQWPDQPERVHRARAAIALAHGDPVTVLQGDAVDDVAHQVAAVADHALPVVMATWVLSYLPADSQRAFLASLDAAAEGRDLTLVWADQPVIVPGLDPPPRPDGKVDERPTALVRVDWRDGRRLAAVRLADQHPHGTWLEWLQPG
jgi:hypothetical protein